MSVRRTIFAPAGDPAGGDAAAIAAAESWGSQGLKRTGVKSGAYTLAPGNLVPVDASGGAVPLTLPNAPADGARFAFKIILQAATPNAVTLATSGADVFNKAAGSTSLSFAAVNTAVTVQYDATTKVYTVASTDSPIGVASGAASLGSDGKHKGSEIPTSVVNGASGGAARVPVADGNGAYIWATPKSRVDGLPLVASRNGGNLPGTTTLPITTEIAHTALVACSDLRVVYGSQDGGEADLPNSVYVKAGIMVPVSLTLSSTLGTGAPITTLPTAALVGGGIPAGTKIRITQGTNTQTFTSTGTGVFAGTANVPVSSLTPNFAYTSAATVTAEIVYPLTFSGRAFGILDYPSGMLVSDPLAIELAASQSFHSLTYVSMPMGAATTLAAASLLNATTLSLAAPPSPTMSLPQQLWVDTGGNQEAVTVTAVTNTQTALTTALTSGVAATSLAVNALPNALPSGSAVNLNDGAGHTQTFVLSGAAAQGATSVSVTSLAANFSYPIGTLASTYNVTCTAATKAHAAAVTAQQLTPCNTEAFSDLGDRVAFSADDAYIGGVPNNAALTTTLNANANAGDQKVTLAANLALADTNPTITIDTGGTPETIGVLSAGGANTYYLAAPLANNHTSGATCTGSTFLTGGFSPYSIHAERVATHLKPVVVKGNSIASGQGNITRGLFSSFATKALRGVRPYLTGAKPSESASAYAYDVWSRRRRRLMNIAGGPLGGWVLWEYGTNDVFGGTSLATMQGYLQTEIAACHVRGFKLAITTLPPKTSSSDNWTSLANQAFLQDQTHENLRLAYNAWVRASAVSGGYADLIIDTAATVDSGLVNSQAESGLWAVQNFSGVGWVTTGGVPLAFDGTHPTFLGHQLMSAAVTAALASMT